MRSKLNFLINVSLKKKINSKWFWIANIIIASLIIAIINVDSIITLFGGDFDSKTKIYIYDDVGSIQEKFEENLAIYEENFYGSSESFYEIVTPDISYDEMIEKIKEEAESSIVISIYVNENGLVESKIVSLSSIDSYDYQLISNSITTSANTYILDSIGLSEEQYNKILNGINIKREILDNNITSEDENTHMIMTTVFPILILPFFMLIIFLVQFIGSEVNDEKSTRSMEIIISNVSPGTHFSSKIIANNLFILLQVILIIIYAVIGVNLRRLLGGDSILNGVGSEVANMIKMVATEVFADKLIVIFIFTILLMVLTFIAYSLLAGILASMTTNTEDYQQIQVPIMIVLLLGYYLAIMAGMFEGSLFIKILSFVPLISAILTPSLLVMGQIGIVEVIISTIFMVITILILLKYGLRIYKVGILNYSQSGIWKKIFSSIRAK